MLKVNLLISHVSRLMKSKAASLPTQGEIHFQNPDYLDLSDALDLEKRSEQDLKSHAQHLKDARLLVMGSGNGSNFEALVHALRPCGIEFAGLFCDRPQARIIERARRLEVPVHGPKQRLKKRALNDAIVAFLAQPFCLLVLAGYMRILPPRVVTPHLGKIVNIHPSLLPAFPGLDAIQQAVDAGADRVGVTVHLVDQEVDGGPILGQAHLPRLQGESDQELEARVHLLEHRLYPQMLLRLLAKRNTKS